MPFAEYERAVAEEKLAWCIAVRAPRDLVARLREALAQGDIETVNRSADAMLPRSRGTASNEPVQPVRDGEETVLDNGLLQARTDARGVLLELASPRIAVPVAQANILSGLGRSKSAMAIELRSGEPFLRVTLNVDLRILWGSLKLENWFAFGRAQVRYGIDRRFAALEDDRAGAALFVRDPLDWESRPLRRGGVYLGATLLRERGEARLAWAYAPFEPGISMGTLERAWERFALEPRVRLFTSADPAIVVTRCAPAEDGDGAVVTLRECDGAERELRLRCGARMREVDGDARIDGEEIVARIGAFRERAFRVRF